MKKIILPILLATLLTLQGSAQIKISGKISCDKPDPNYSLEIGDQPNHTLSLAKAACTWTTPLEIGGIKSKDAIDISAIDLTATNMRQNGYSTTNMTNGDKFTVKYQGSAQLSKKAPPSFEGKWSFSSGTGNLRGIKGGGTFKGIGAPDGSGVVEVEGEYTLGGPKAGSVK